MTATAYPTVIGQGDGEIELKVRGTLAAGATETYFLDNLLTGQNGFAKDNVELSVWLEVHASSGSGDGARVTAMPLNAFMGGTYVPKTHRRYAQDVGRESYTFSSDVLKTTVNDGDIQASHDVITLTDVDNLNEDDLIIFDDDPENSFLVDSISGNTVTLDGAISTGSPTNQIAQSDVVVRRQGIMIPLRGVPTLGWLIRLKNLDTVNAHKAEMVIKATTGSTLA